MFGLKSESKELRKQQQEKLQQEKLQQEKLEEQKKEEKQKRELEILQQLDVEARQKLQGEFKERYLLAKAMGLEKQAEIARIEGMTNTQFIDLKEQERVLRKKVSMKLGYSVGGEHYDYPGLRNACSSIQGFPAKITLGVMTRYQEVKDFFDKIEIMHFDIGSDPLMYGIKRWGGEELNFLIMMWE
jgi:hypothetical protein